MTTTMHNPVMEKSLGMCEAYAASQAEILRTFPQHDATMCPNEATRLVMFDGGSYHALCDFHAAEVESWGPARPDLPR